MRTLIFCLFLGFSLTAGAANWLAFKNSVIERYTDQDLELLFGTLTRALDNSADGESLSWNNSKTNSSGSIRPLNSFQKDGLPCRLVEVINRFKQQTARSEYTFCKIPQQGWKFLDATVPPAKASSPAEQPEPEDD